MGISQERCTVCGIRGVTIQFLAGKAKSYLIAIGLAAHEEPHSTVARTRSALTPALSRRARAGVRSGWRELIRYEGGRKDESN